VQNTAVPRERLLSVRHNAVEVTRRRAHVYDWPVTNLNTWVLEVVRQSPLLPPGAEVTVPWFDPEGGGEEASLLFLMQDPSEVATGTGFISPDNDDPTAQNTTVACAAAGIPRAGRVHWNVFPHWVNVTREGRPADPTRAPQTYGEARPVAVRFLRELIDDHLPNLTVIVLLGGEAQRGWDMYRNGGGSLPAGVLEPFRCPSCSPRAWNNKDKVTGVKNSVLTIETLKEAWALAS